MVLLTMLIISVSITVEQSKELIKSKPRIIGLMQHYRTCTVFCLIKYIFDYYSSWLNNNNELKTGNS